MCWPDFRTVLLSFAMDYNIIVLCVVAVVRAVRMDAIVLIVVPIVLWLSPIPADHCYFPSAQPMNLP